MVFPLRVHVHVQCHYSTYLHALVILLLCIIELLVEFTQLSSVVMETNMNITVCVSADSSSIEMPISVLLTAVNGTAGGELMLFLIIVCNVNKKYNIILLYRRIVYLCYRLIAIANIIILPR